MSLSFSSIDNCPRCNKHVFFADELLAMGKKWHLQCFTCSKCNKPIDQTSYSNHGATYSYESDDIINCSRCSTQSTTNGRSPSLSGIALTVGKSLDEDDSDYRCKECDKVIIYNSILNSSPSSKTVKCKACCT
ncbi:hypothetical protein LOTGIDRAFT_233396 [Lottia gigantea]|uniref:LIM zinc-binding domain-containing protein n=1 Tax=Lottia gigantea TaxID=225164 RepID=V4A966_LOTGI|nr:hypothetical protein LOTGIDRAFT_233396 [Lottia gigantea]ESO91610.1 hypothetical protein LOTGIDRAFT_233396 [Lottia gigantea]